MHPAIRKDAVAVITGAAVGIGYAIAERMAQEKMKLVLSDKNVPALAECYSSFAFNISRINNPSCNRRHLIRNCSGSTASSCRVDR